MQLATVIGKVWSERQLPGLAGCRLVAVRDLTSSAVCVAVDLVDVSAGSMVLVATDEAAQALAGSGPADAVVVALVAGMDEALKEVIR